VKNRSLLGLIVSIIAFALVLLLTPDAGASTSGGNIHVASDPAHINDLEQTGRIDTRERRDSPRSPSAASFPFYDDFESGASS